MLPLLLLPARIAGSGWLNPLDRELGIGAEAYDRVPVLLLLLSPAVPVELELELTITVALLLALLLLLIAFCVGDWLGLAPIDRTPKLDGEGTLA